MTEGDELQRIKRTERKLQEALTLACHVESIIQSIELLDITDLNRALAKMKRDRLLLLDCMKSATQYIKEHIQLRKEGRNIMKWLNKTSGIVEASEHDTALYCVIPTNPTKNRGSDKTTPKKMYKNPAKNQNSPTKRSRALRVVNV